MSYTELGYTPGWCGQCGRRLGRDNRCGNCDPWWTSPIFHYVGGLAILVTFVVLGIIAFSRPSSDPSLAGGGGSGGANGATSGEPQYLPSGGTSASASYPASPSLVAASMGGGQWLPAAVVSASGGQSRGASPVTEEEVNFARLLELRQMTAYVDSVIADRYANRSESERAGLALRPRKMGSGAATLDREEGR